MDRFRPRLTYANVVSSLALFIAVGGGTAFAVVAANQVNSASIIDGQVKNQDLADSSVGPFKIKAGGVLTDNLADNSVGPLKIKTGGVQNSDLGAGAVDSAKVLDGSLLKEDFGAGQLPKGDPCLSSDPACRGPKGDRGPGAIQFDLHAEEGGFAAPAPEVEGLTAAAYCDSTRTVITFYARSRSEAVGVSGLAIANGAFEQITSQTTDHYSLAKEGVNSFDMDVVARDLSVNKWTHFVLGTYNDRTRHGCNFWGVITPPSN